MSDWTEIDMMDIGLLVRVRMTDTPWMFFEAREPADDDDPMRNAIMAGYIKWDGCAEVDGFHVCDRGQAVRVGVLFDRLYNLAAERMPQHKEYLT